MTRKVRRFRLCDDCWERVVPSFGEAVVEHGSPEQKQVERFWRWFGVMEERYPTKRNWRPVLNRPLLHTVESYWPYCAECGAETKEYQLGNVTRPSIFGGPRARYCPVCEAKKLVESIAGMIQEIHPDWDDEDFLDLFYKSHRSAFEIGVLPDYWFELRRNVG